MHREALEEAGITVANPILFAHEEIDPHDGVAADPKYPVPSFQVFYVARLVARARSRPWRSAARPACSHRAKFAPPTGGRSVPLYEAALETARRELTTP